MNERTIGLPPKPLSLDAYPFVLNSQSDDGGIATNLSNTALYDATKYWASGIWQNALLIISVGGRIYNTIATTNTNSTVTFPSIDFEGIVTQNVKYVLKRLPPALTRPGISLTGTQRLKLFSVVSADPSIITPGVVPWIVPSIAPGVPTHFYDTETGMPTPYLIPKGYILTLVEKYWHGNQDIEMLLYFDGVFVDYQANDPSDDIYVAGMINSSTTLFDPKALSAHWIDLQLVNNGLSNLKGSYEIVAIEESLY